MKLIVENVRLKELVAIVESNRPFYDDFSRFLAGCGYGQIGAFINEPNDSIAYNVILQYLNRPLPSGVVFYDGLARPYSQKKAKWLFWGWILRDAPAQRLNSLLSEQIGKTTEERKAAILNELRKTLPHPLKNNSRWHWEPVSEVFIDRLEGSRRAIKGNLIEAMIRSTLRSLFRKHEMNLEVLESEVRIDGETYDIEIRGAGGRLLIPVKTRETMGGGHALLFTRDLHKSITKASEKGLDCLPIIIAESWTGLLDSLASDDFIYVCLNPNQLVELQENLESELQRRIKVFEKLI